MGLRFVAALLLSLALVSLAQAQSAAPDETVVEVSGSATIGKDIAAAQDEAVWDANRKAVHQAVGVLLKSRTLVKNFELIEDELVTRSEGFVRRYEIVSGSRRIEQVGNGRILFIKVRVTVGLLSVLKRLSDIDGAFSQLARPRIRIEVVGDSVARTVHTALTSYFRGEGFQVATSGPADITLLARLASSPVVRYGEANTPYGIGEAVGAAKVQLSMRLISSVSEEAILSTVCSGKSVSLDGDSDALDGAARQAVSSFLRDNAQSFLQSLLVRWAREREEGYTVQLHVACRRGPPVDAIQEQIRAFRGTRKLLSAQETANGLTLRFVTSLDRGALKRRLSEIKMMGARMQVVSDSGTRIHCMLR